MRRRALIGTALTALAAPRAVWAESARPYRIGVLTPAAQQWEPQAFRDGLRSLGYVEGQNIVIDVRSAEGSLDRLPELAADLAGSRPDVIVAVNTPGARAAIGSIKTIPIVMTVVGDPVGSGLVDSLARPGGNATGLSNLSGELAAKRLSILKEFVPAAQRIAILFNPQDPVTVPQIGDTEGAGPLIGVALRRFPVREIAELSVVFERLAEWRAEAAMWLAGQAGTLEQRTVEPALRARLPVMYALKRNVRVGGLVSYFADNSDLFRQTAVYIDKILKGAKPADLPVQQPTRFELTINLKTAKAIGLAVPPSMLALADEVIE
jgi:putative tryptophan/tyrosine transport system substrate-binding protein